MCINQSCDLWFLSKTRLLGTRNQNAKTKAFFFRIYTNGCLGEKKKGMDERKKPKHEKLYPSIFNMFKKRV